ncbi:hypothetical protein F4824DRAFT_491259 [Ustulina deusta]|nr:hypothetical protein F4824DRAFT_491259 [Ustulina deusta]
MASQQTFQVTTGGKDYVDRTIQVLTPAFKDDPIYTWLLHHFPLSEHQSVLPKLFCAFLTQGSLNSGLFVEVDDFGCCGLLMPPGAEIENPWTLLQADLIPALFTIGLRSFKRALLDYPGAVELEKEFTKEEQENHWYIFIMRINVDQRRRGLAGAFLEAMQGWARRDKRPIWLEATTTLSRDLYLKDGFTAIGEVVVGRGSVGPDGLPKDGGEGVTIWSMCWRP